MDRINTSYFYVLAQKLIPLYALSSEKTMLEVFGDVHQAESEIRMFLANSLLPPMTCSKSGQELHDAIQKLLDTAFSEEGKLNEKLSWGEVQAVEKGLSDFEVALQADFGTRDTFIVSPKGAYSTTLLAERGELVLTREVHKLVPNVSQDIHDGCRCLAFELPTAAAFHFFRAVEAMTKAYGEYVRQKPFSEKEKKGGLGSYANLLKEHVLAVDKRLINTIEQIASLHRNPTMHPEMHISKTEIMATLGMVVSVMETIAIDWTRREITPEVPLMDIIPDDSKVLALLEDGNENSSTVGAGAIQLRNEEHIVRAKVGDAKTTGRRSRRKLTGNEIKA